MADFVLCRAKDCGKVALWRVSTRRGENIEVCHSHKDGLKASMVAPVIVWLGVHAPTQQEAE